jgi:formate dehydrogenase alpha subunit
MFNPIDYRRSEDLRDEEYAFTLPIGRRYAHYLTRTMTGRCPSLHKEMPQPIAQINEQDAVKLGFEAGGRARIVSRHGEVETFVRPGDIVPKGAIFMDFHFAEANSNVLLGTSLDPVSKTPDYKLCAVRIENPNGDHVESEGMDMV